MIPQASFLLGMLVISMSLGCHALCPDISAPNFLLTLQAYGPEYKVVGVQSREVLLNAGNIHCITQQQPAEW